PARLRPVPTRRSSDLACTDSGDVHRDPSGPAREARVPVAHRRAARVIRGANVLHVTPQPRVEQVDGGAGIALDERGDVAFHDTLRSEERRAGTGASWGRLVAS